MSNVSTVTPYDTTSSISIGEVAGDLARAAAGAAVITAGVAVALAQWLSEETEADQAAVDRLRTDRRQERLTLNTPGDLQRSAERLRLTSAGLHLRDPETLVRTAEKLGFQMEPLAQPKVPLARQPQILLRSASGERLAIERGREGRLALHTAGNERRIQKLIRQHTLDRALDHLKAKGMNVQTATMANGETQILAHERDTGQRGGAAEVKAQVRTDGTVRVDIDCVRGNRCENIVSELAEAVGGQMSHMKKKDAFFQLPGEPTKLKQKV